jgi:hypothetical protein
VTGHAWRRAADVAWLGDEARVVAARTSPPDADGPRILEGAAAWLWACLSEPLTEQQLAEESGQPAFVRAALEALQKAGLIEPA